MTETVVSLVERLNLERDKTLAFFATLTIEQWNVPVYTGPIPWTSRNILAHIVSAERQFLQLFQDVQGGGSGAPENFNADAFNASEQDRLREVSSQDLLSEFKRLRGETIQWIGFLTLDALEKRGNHPVLGVITLDQMVLSMTLHAHLHARDIRRFFGGT